MTDFHIIIPARYASARLPGKALIAIAGRPLIQHVYEVAAASGASSVTVATDDEAISEACRGFGAAVRMTAADHLSGTDRVAECARLAGFGPDELIVNLQGDEPLTPPPMLAELAAHLASAREASMATVAAPISSAEELHDPNVVKVVCDAAGQALYFSRAPLPWNRDDFAAGAKPLPAGDYLRHIGVYAYRNRFLQRITTLATSPAELAERLEQLRALHHGAKIAVMVSKTRVPAGVDTAVDLKRVSAVLTRDSGS